MDLGAGWADLGLPGLFLASFLAATLLPLGSELVLAAMLLGPWSSVALWATASVGNTLGGLTNYAIGRWVPQEKLLRWTRIDPAKAARWERPVQRYGVWCALLCWLPVVGDPLALALGLLRVRPWPVTALMFVGKAVRYAALIAAFRH